MILRKSMWQQNWINFCSVPRVYTNVRSAENSLYFGKERQGRSFSKRTEHLPQWKSKNNDISFFHASFLKRVTRCHKHAAHPPTRLRNTTQPPGPSPASRLYNSFAPSFHHSPAGFTRCCCGRRQPYPPHHFVSIVWSATCHSSSTHASGGHSIPCHYPGRSGK